MIEFAGEIYYIDIKALDASISPDQNYPEKVTDIEKTTHKGPDGKIKSVIVVERTYTKGKEIDGAKYETLRTCLEVLIDYTETTDETLGIDRALASTPLAYKLAFNTLIKEGILKQQE